MVIILLTRPMGFTLIDLRLKWYFALLPGDTSGGMEIMVLVDNISIQVTCKCLLLDLVEGGY